METSCRADRSRSWTMDSWPRVTSPRTGLLACPAPVIGRGLTMGPGRLVRELDYLACPSRASVRYAPLRSVLPGCTCGGDPCRSMDRAHHPRASCRCESLQ